MTRVVVGDDRSYCYRRTSICRYSETRRKSGGAFVVADNSYHATSFEINLGYANSISTPTISSAATPAAKTF
ncbi:MAG: hypothetical protein OEM81_14125 [Acidimicrobiia bacterium]|nr:hypothetical protein [Acidimicrobiia bacterium]